VETPEIVVAVKAKLTEARRKLRELNAKKGRVKQQGQGMSKKLKGAREAGRRVNEVEREVLGLREDEASARAAAAPPGSREEELFDLSRDHSKRGAPYHEVFSEVIGPAMLSTGASGEQITEILRLYELRFYEPGKGPSEPPGSDWWQARRHVAGAMSDVRGPRVVPHRDGQECGAGRLRRVQDQPTKRAHVGGAMSEAYAWYRVAIAPRLLQQGVDETKINGQPTMNKFIAVPNLEDPLHVDFLHLRGLRREGGRRRLCASGPMRQSTKKKNPKKSKNKIPKIKNFR